MPTAMSRRQLMTSMGIGAGTLLLPRAGRAAPLIFPRREIARGTVYDAHASRNTRGIAGVMVSNGRDVVLTDANGRWSLPVAPGEMIFAIKPPHWKAATGERAKGLCYLYEPFGPSEDFARSAHGSTATGPLPSSIDFALQRAPESERFDALLVADSQTYDARELAYFDLLLTRSVARLKPAFAVHHGDVMADDLSLFPDYLRLIARTGIDWHHCPGNHDMDLDAARARHAFAAWKRFIGPPHTAFQFAGATFILLNNVAPIDRPDGVGINGYRGHIGDDQLTFVSNVLKYTPRESLVVVSMHIPLVNFDAPTSRSDTTDDRARLLALLSDRPHNVSFAGHSHTTEHHYLGREDGYLGDQQHHHHVLTAACGSWWSGPPDANGVPVSVSRDGTPKGVHLLSVDGNSYTTRFEAFAEGSNEIARIIPINDGQRLLVDVFDGGPRTEVACEFEEGSHDRIELGREKICDPLVDTMLSCRPDLCKPWVKASPSSHVWTAELPNGATPTAVTIRDEYGRFHRVPAAEAFARRV